MFSLTWIFGFTFWLFYVVFGLIFCVVFMRKFAPTIYKIVAGVGKIGKDSDGDFTIDGSFEATRLDVVLVVFGSFLLWPVGFICLSIWGIFYIFSSTLMKVLFSAIKATSKKVPKGWTLF